MKANKTDYENLYKCLKNCEFLSLDKTNFSVTRYVWEVLNGSNFLMVNREIYDRLDDNNIETLAKKVLRDLGKI